MFRGDFNNKRHYYKINYYAGYTPLAHAVLGKHLQALKKLVKMGADVNLQDAQGRTCLSIAAYQVRKYLR